MDLTSFKINDSVVVKIKDPRTGRPAKGVTITVLSRHSTAFRDNLTKMRSAGIISEDDDALELAANALAAATIGWTGIVESGVELECSQENAARVYKTYPLIREQIDAVLGDNSRFLAEQKAS